MNHIQNKEKTRVLHVLGKLDHGGVENWLINVLRHIDREMIQMDFCCLSGVEGVQAELARSLGSKVITCKLTKNLLSFNRRFAGVLASGGYDIVHSHVHFFSGYILRCAAKSNIQQRIAHGHTSPSSLQQSYSRRFYIKVMQTWLKKYATLGLGISKASLSSLYGEKWYEQEHLMVLYCGIDLAPYLILPSGSHLRRQIGIPEQNKIVGHLGRLTPAKNHKFFLQIAKSIQSKRENIWFLIVGDGPLRKELEDFCANLDLKNVIFIGDVTNVVPYLAEMDLLLFPSLWEGLPLSVVEAQAADLYCLCSDVITEEVAILPDAVQFESLNASTVDWADKSIEILDKPSIPPGMGVSILTKTPFSITNNVEKLTQLYRSAN